MVQPPEHVLGSVASDPEIHRIARSVIACPDFFPVSFPPLRDRIANEDDLCLSPAADARSFKSFWRLCQP